MKTSIPLLIVLKFLVNIFLMVGLDRYLPQYVTVFGGVAALVIIGALLTLMNMFVRPMLKIATAPARFVFGLPVIILLNFVFLWLTYQIVLLMDPSLVVLAISGGVEGWLVTSVIVGLVNWGMKRL